MPTSPSPSFVPPASPGLWPSILFWLAFILQFTGGLASSIFIGGCFFVIAINSESQDIFIALLFLGIMFFGGLACYLAWRARTLWQNGVRGFAVHKYFAPIWFLLFSSMLIGFLDGLLSA